MKKYTAYILIFIGLTLSVKTAPLAVHKFLYLYNVENTFGIDMTNCSTIGFSVFAAEFFYPLFIFSLLCLIVGLLLILRRRSYTKITDIKNKIFFTFLLGLIIANLGYISYIYLLMKEDSLFEKHFVFSLAFIISVLTFFLLLVIIILVWFDSKLSVEIKIVGLVFLFYVTTGLCLKMLLFIDLYGISSQNPDVYNAGLNYILAKLGLGTFCMEENPCNIFFQDMRDACAKARDAKTIPRIPNGGGPASLTWIARVMNAAGGFHKYKKNQDCFRARKSYNDCMNIFKSINNPKKK